MISIPPSICVQNENSQFQTQLSSSTSEKDTLIAELRGNVTTLQSEKSQAAESFQQQLSKLQSDLETQHQAALEEMMSNVNAELKVAHEKEISQVSGVLKFPLSLSHLSSRWGRSLTKRSLLYQMRFLV
jgi:DNA anti-recombination protein RmuC